MGVFAMSHCYSSVNANAGKTLIIVCLFIACRSSVNMFQYRLPQQNIGESTGFWYLVIAVNIQTGTI